MSLRMPVRMSAHVSLYRYVHMSEHMPGHMHDDLRRSRTPELPDRLSPQPNRLARPLPRCTWCGAERCGAARIGTARRSTRCRAQCRLRLTGATGNPLIAKHHMEKAGRWLPTHLPTYLHACMPAYLHTCIPAYLPTYAPTSCSPSEVGSSSNNSTNTLESVPASARWLKCVLVLYSPTRIRRSLVEQSRLPPIEDRGTGTYQNEWLSPHLKERTLRL